MSDKKSKFWPRIAYSCGTFGHDVFYAMLAMYFMIFVTSNLFHSENHEHDAYMIGIVTTIILVLRVGELFLDPFIGNTIDKTKTRWGKFKPWVIVGAFVAAISLAILFTDMGGLTVSNPMLYLVLFAVLYLIMDVFYSAKDVAIWSMIPALSFDSREREVTATYARIGSVFGGQLVTAIVMPVVLYFSLNENGGAGDSTGWFAFAVIGGGIATLGAIILGLGTKEEDSALRENKTETSFKGVFSVLIKNDQLLWIAIAYLIYGLGVNIINNFNLYYFIYVLGDAKQFSFLGVINVIIGLLAVALFPTLTEKFSRRKLFFGSVAVMLASIVLYAMAGTSVVMTSRRGACPLRASAGGQARRCDCERHDRPYRNLGRHDERCDSGDDCSGESLQLQARDVRCAVCPHPARHDSLPREGDAHGGGARAHRGRTRREMG